MLVWLLYIIAECFIQVKSIQAGNKPIYLVLFIIRGMASIAQGIILNVQYGTLQYPVLLGFQVCSFWIFFDLLINLLRKKPALYRGITSGWLDRINLKVWYILKLTAVIGMIFFYIKGLEYWKF